MQVDIEIRIAVRRMRKNSKSIEQQHRNIQYSIGFPNQTGFDSSIKRVAGSINRIGLINRFCLSRVWKRKFENIQHMECQKMRLEVNENEWKRHCIAPIIRWKILSVQ